MNYRNCLNVYSHICLQNFPIRPLGIVLLIIFFSILNISAQNNTLWVNPVNLESRDLFFGEGGQAHQPKGEFSMVNVNGSPEKVVNDSNGRSWLISVGAGSKAEVAASRIVWALGFHVSKDYLINPVQIKGHGGGNFQDVRFKLREDGFDRVGSWSWNSNPFFGSREFRGLKVLMAILTNWNLNDVNNLIVRPRDHDERIHFVFDLSSTLGKGSSFSSSRTKGNPIDFEKDKFLEETPVSEGTVRFHFKNSFSSLLTDIRVEDARWMASLLNRLSDKQLSDAFRAGGFNSADVATYVKVIRRRANQLLALN